MASGEQGEGYIPSGWRVTPLRTETVELANEASLEVTYLLRAHRGGMRIEAFENGALVEEHLVLRGVHELVMEMHDIAGGRVQVAVLAGEELMKTHVVIDGEELRVETAPGEGHMRIVDRELKARQLPEHRRIRLLADAIRTDDGLRAELRRQTRFGPDVVVANGISNGAVAGCAAACFLCALGSFAGCVACAICIEIPHESGGTPITVLKA